MRESLVEDYLKEQVTLRGGFTRKIKWPGRRGAPDRMVGLNKRHALVEVKRPGKGAEAAQAREHVRLREVGFDVRVIDSIEAVDALVSELMA